jgi:hypothetical protein
MGGGLAVSLQHFLASNRQRYAFIITDSTAQDEVTRLLQSSVVAATSCNQPSDISDATLVKLKSFAEW